MSMARNGLTAGRVAGTVVAALLVASCTMPDWNQFQTPKLDVNQFIPPDPNQFARQQRTLQAIGPADLVDGSGNCAGGPAPAAAAAPAGDVQAGAAPPPPPPTPCVHGARIGLEMTECEVVRAAGPPAEVQISANERGDRTVVMIFPAADKPTFRFVGGRLKVVERGAEPPPEQPARKQPPRRQRS
jgi:hypothetical protein